MSMKTLLFALCACIPALAVAGPTDDSAKDFGDYIVYYNALTTDFLQPDIAQLHEIRRSKNRVLLTVSVHRKDNAAPGQPVAAKVEGNAVNLNAQLRPLAFREVREENALYYIADFPVSNMETLDFAVRVMPGEREKAYDLKFRKQFFTN